jgi:hypothetical protein
MKNIIVTFFEGARCVSASLCLLTLLVISACGGGEGGSWMADVGTGGTGLAEGTVTGFGSVIVDGIEYDDSNATIGQDDGTGAIINADLQLGHRVQLTLNADRSVKSATVLPQLVGTASTAMDASGSFLVMGQRVRLAGSASDTTQSTAAVLAGFDTTAIAASDSLEVHGTWVFDKQLACYVLIASRVEKLTTLPALLQLSGVVQAITGNVLLLNTATGLKVQAANLPSGVAVGHLVRVWATQAAWKAVAFNTLQASRVMGSTLTADVIATQTLRLSGTVASYDADTRTVEIQGTKVQLSPQLQLNEQALAQGAFVSLEVRRSDDDLVADSGTQRGEVGTATDLGQSVTLKEISNDIDWSSDPVPLSLRGVTVTAAASTISSTCRQANPNTDLLVEVTGLWSSSVNTVVAQKIQCTPVSIDDEFETHSTIDRKGVVSQINLTTRTFRLQTKHESVSVQWDGQTFFATEFKNHPESLTGQSVEVEGVYKTGIFWARTIKRSQQHDD